MKGRSAKVDGGADGVGNGGFEGQTDEESGLEIYTET